MVWFKFQCFGYVGNGYVVIVLQIEGYVVQILVVCEIGGMIGQCCQMFDGVVGIVCIQCCFVVFQQYVYVG